jgi:CxxC-x17-CxxC domain-containing protein
MHKAVCDECGKDCEVPFKPSGGKPIYCSNCFEGKDASRGPRRPRRRGPRRESSFGRRDNSGKQLLEQIKSVNAKLDRILKLLESGSKKKPVAKKPEVKKVPKQEASKKNVKKVSSKVAAKVTPEVAQEVPPKTVEEIAPKVVKETVEKEAGKSVPNVKEESSEKAEAENIPAKT